MPALLYKFQGQELRFQLKDLTSIGRGRDSDLCVPCESISGLHAVITRDEEGYQLEDTGSSNGILVDGRRVLSCLLKEGSTFALGDVEFIFTSDDGEAGEAEVAAPAAEPVSTETDQSAEAGIPTSRDCPPYPEPQIRLRPLRPPIRHRRPFSPACPSWTSARFPSRGRTISSQICN
jgi:pSer/pThr/pTyr-binding forkhead associated (FHA) protein